MAVLYPILRKKRQRQNFNTGKIIFSFEVAANQKQPSKKMKKILFAAVLMAASSCTHLDQKISFDFDFDNEKQNIGRGIGIDILVSDERGTDQIGTKEFSSEEKIKISSKDNLAEILRQKVTENLYSRGFKKGWDNTIEIHVLKLKYNAKSEFFIGKSKAEAVIKAVVVNNRNGASLTKNLSSSLDGKHFIRPLESTDKSSINSLIKEIVQNILEDEEIIKRLTQ